MGGIDQILRKEITLLIGILFILVSISSIVAGEDANLPVVNYDPWSCGRFSGSQEVRIENMALPTSDGDEFCAPGEPYWEDGLMKDISYAIKAVDLQESAILRKLTDQDNLEMMMSGWITPQAIGYWGGDIGAVTIETLDGQCGWESMGLPKPEVISTSTWNLYGSLACSSLELGCFGDNCGSSGIDSRFPDPNHYNWNFNFEVGMTCLSGPCGAGPNPINSFMNAGFLSSMQNLPCQGYHDAYQNWACRSYSLSLKEQEDAERQARVLFVRNFISGGSAELFCLENKLKKIMINNKFLKTLDSEKEVHINDETQIEIKSGENHVSFELMGISDCRGNCNLEECRVSEYCTFLGKYVLDNWPNMGESRVVTAFDNCKGHCENLQCADSPACNEDAGIVYFKIDRIDKSWKAIQNLGEDPIEVGGEKLVYLNEFNNPDVALCSAEVSFADTDDCLKSVKLVDANDNILSSLDVNSRDFCRDDGVCEYPLSNELLPRNKKVKCIMQTMHREYESDFATFIESNVKSDKTYRKFLGVSPPRAMSENERAVFLFSDSEWKEYLSSLSGFMWYDERDSEWCVSDLSQPLSLRECAQALPLVYNSEMSQETRESIRIFLDKYRVSSIYSLEENILKIPEMGKFNVPKIMKDSEEISSLWDSAGLEIVVSEDDYSAALSSALLSIYLNLPLVLVNQDNADDITNRALIVVGDLQPSIISELEEDNLILSANPDADFVPSPHENPIQFKYATGATRTFSKESLEQYLRIYLKKEILFSAILWYRLGELDFPTSYGEGDDALLAMADELNFNLLNTFEEAGIKQEGYVSARLEKFLGQMPVELNKQNNIVFTNPNDIEESFCDKSEKSDNSGEGKYCKFSLFSPILASSNKALIGFVDVFQPGPKASEFKSYLAQTDGSPSAVNAASIFEQKVDLKIDEANTEILDVFSRVAAPKKVWFLGGMSAIPSGLVKFWACTTCKRKPSEENLYKYYLRDYLGEVEFESYSGIYDYPTLSSAWEAVVRNSFVSLICDPIENFESEINLRAMLQYVSALISAYKLNPADVFSFRANAGQWQSVRYSDIRTNLNVIPMSLLQGNNAVSPSNLERFLASRPLTQVKGVPQNLLSCSLGKYSPIEQKGAIGAFYNNFNKLRNGISSAISSIAAVNIYLGKPAMDGLEIDGVITYIDSSEDDDPQRTIQTNIGAVIPEVGELVNQIQNNPLALSYDALLEQVTDAISDNQKLCQAYNDARLVLFAYMTRRNPVGFSNLNREISLSGRTSAGQPVTLQIQIDDVEDLPGLIYKLELGIEENIRLNPLLSGKELEEYVVNPSMSRQAAEELRDNVVTSAVGLDLYANILRKYYPLKCGAWSPEDTKTTKRQEISDALTRELENMKSASQEYLRKARQVLYRIASEAGDDAYSKIYEDIEVDVLDSSGNPTGETEIQRVVVGTSPEDPVEFGEENALFYDDKYFKVDELLESSPPVPQFVIKSNDVYSAVKSDADYFLQMTNEQREVFYRPTKVFQRSVADFTTMVLSPVMTAVGFALPLTAISGSAFVAASAPLIVNYISITFAAIGMAMAGYSVHEACFDADLPSLDWVQVDDVEMKSRAVQLSVISRDDREGCAKAVVTAAMMVAPFIIFPLIDMIGSRVANPTEVVRFSMSERTQAALKQYLMRVKAGESPARVFNEVSSSAGLTSTQRTLLMRTIRETNAALLSARGGSSTGASALGSSTGILNPDGTAVVKPKPLVCSESGKCPVGADECFLAGTKIKMADGSEKNIEEIVEGDLVIAWDLENSAAVSAPVKETFVRSADSYLKITYEVIDE